MLGQRLAGGGAVTWANGRPSARAVLSRDLVRRFAIVVV
jgi:hypothetical protein